MLTRKHSSWQRCITLIGPCIVTWSAMQTDSQRNFCTRASILRYSVLVPTTPEWGAQAFVFWPACKKNSQQKKKPTTQTNRLRIFNRPFFYWELRSCLPMVRRTHYENKIQRITLVNTHWLSNATFWQSAVLCRFSACVKPLKKEPDILPYQKDCYK